VTRRRPARRCKRAHAPRASSARREHGGKQVASDPASGPTCSPANTSDTRSTSPPTWRSSSRSTTVDACAVSSALSGAPGSGSLGTLGELAQRTADACRRSRRHDRTNHGDRRRPTRHVTFAVEESISARHLVRVPPRCWPTASLLAVGDVAQTDPGRTIGAPRAAGCSPSSSRPASGPFVHPPPRSILRASLGEGVWVGPHVASARGRRSAMRAVAARRRRARRRRRGSARIACSTPRVSADRCVAGDPRRAAGRRGDRQLRVRLAFSRRTAGERSADRGSSRWATTSEIGAKPASTVPRPGFTSIGTGTEDDNPLPDRHNARMGNNHAIAASPGLAGTRRSGYYVRVGGPMAFSGPTRRSGTGHHRRRLARLGDVPDGAFVSGQPAQDHRSWVRRQGVHPPVAETVSPSRRAPKRAATQELGQYQNDYATRFRGSRGSAFTPAPRPIRVLPAPAGQGLALRRRRRGRISGARDYVVRYRALAPRPVSAGTASRPSNLLSALLGLRGGQTRRSP